MPYIKDEYKNQFLDMFCHIPEMRNSGELNYALTMLCKDYINDKGLSYQTLNDIMGALEGCKQEFYRRVVAPYEDKKIAENGDVYVQFGTSYL
jgi:hypothetical protein